LISRRLRVSALKVFSVLATDYGLFGITTSMLVKLRSNSARRP